MGKPLATGEERLWTPANIVTLLRICGVPLFVVALLSPWPTWLFPGDLQIESWKEWIAAGIFILLAATDGLDGYLARKRDEVTNFGKFMDPLADKILVAAALLALVELGVLPSWVALIILCREFIVSGIRMVAATQGVVIAASWYGKFKTVAQIIALLLFIIKDNHMVSDFSSVLSDKLYLISWAVMVVALVLTIASMLDYFSKARELLGFRPKKTRGMVVASASSKAGEEPDDGAGAEVVMSVDVAAAQAVDLYEAARPVIEHAAERGKMIGTAESCTGGMVAEALTAIAGSSQVMAGAVVSYSNEVKEHSLQVSSDTLASVGAVSEQTAIEMACGARDALGVDVAVSTTGIAGPGGGTPEKPVGTVWIGVADKMGATAELHHFPGDRTAVRQAATQAALRLLDSHLG